MLHFVALMPWGAPVTEGFVENINFAAVYLPFALAAFALIVGIVKFWHKPELFTFYLVRLAAAGLTARVIVVPIIREFVQTIRPFALLGFTPLIAPVYELSFPSSHVAVLAALAFIAWHIRPAAGAALLSGAVIVGVARVLAGVHWPIDILGGVITGGIAALLVLYVPRLLHSPKKTNKKHA